MSAMAMFRQLPTTKEATIFSAVGLVPGFNVFNRISGFLSD
jgi:hypothetical protein